MVPNPLPPGGGGKGWWDDASALGRQILRARAGAGSVGQLERG